jgi:hypothetical protein
MGRTAANESPIKRASKYLLDPVLFAKHILKDDPWPLQEEIMRAVASCSRTAVRSCHSSGKTYTLAQIVLWWLVRWEGRDRSHHGPDGSPGRETPVG